VSSAGMVRRLDQGSLTPGDRVIEVSVQKFLECLDYWTLAKMGRIKTGSQSVFSCVVRVVNVEAHWANPIALIGFEPRDEHVTLRVDIRRLPAAR
jgi:hypothetical protein